MLPSQIREFCRIALVTLAILGSCAYAVDGEPVPLPPTDGKTINSVSVTSPLKLSDSLSTSLSIPDNQIDAQKLAEIRAEQARFATLLRDPDVAKNPGVLIKTAPPAPVSADITALKTEANRIKQQSQSDKAALNAVGIEPATLRGLILFGGILLVCLIVVGWALWHAHVVRKSKAEESWERAHDDDLGMTDLLLLEGNTEYANTQFGNTEFINTEIECTDLHSAEFQTAGNYQAAVGRAGHVPTIDNSSSATALSVPPFAAPLTAHLTELSPPPQPVENLAQHTKLTNRPFTYRRIEGNQGSWAFKFAVKATDASTQHAAKLVDPAQLRKVNEIYDVMQLAESWMSIHDPVQVLETLEPFKDVELPESPIPWLCLLDVYRILGDQEKYEAILKRIKKIFNAKMPSLDEPVGEVQFRKLADYPNIVETILDLWESDDILPYLKNLLVDNRDGTRDGFDLPVYRNILQLINLANDLANDPDRDKRHDQITHGKAYAILYAEAPPPPVSTLAEADADRSSDSFAAKTQIAQAHEMPMQAEVPKPANDYDSMSSMSIRLHLAIAYQDIGDEEGARLLLDEVIKDGTVEQSEKAKLMLAKLP